MFIISVGKKMEERNMKVAKEKKTVVVGGEGYGDNSCRNTLGPKRNILFHVQTSNVSLKKFNKTLHSNK